MNLIPRAVVAVMALHIAMIIAPGSDYALIMRTVGRRGKFAGLLTALGFGTGALTLLLVAILGINALLVQYPILMTALRYIGVAWLLYQAVACMMPDHVNEARRNIGSFGAGFFNHFINAEMVIFYIVVMGQLSSRSVPVWLQLLTALAMSLFVVFWFIVISYFTGKIPNAEKILNHITARLIFCSLFLASAFGLALV